MAIAKTLKKELVKLRAMSAAFSLNSRRRSGAKASPLSGMPTMSVWKEKMSGMAGQSIRSQRSIKPSTGYPLGLKSNAYAVGPSRSVSLCTLRQVPVTRFDDLSRQSASLLKLSGVRKTTEPEVAATRQASASQWDQRS